MARWKVWAFDRGRPRPLKIIASREEQPIGPEKSHNYRVRQECQPGGREVGLSGPGCTDIPHSPCEKQTPSEAPTACSHCVHGGGPGPRLFKQL